MLRTGMSFAALICGALWATPAVSGSYGDDCSTRSNDTQARLTACIRSTELWQHLVAFQKIADANPDRQGHPNRNTGTPGYEASVDYVARLMRAAGYSVSVQAYQWRKFRLTGTPRFSLPGQPLPDAKEWFVARLSGSGSVAATVQPAGASGCAAADFAEFKRGRIALLARGACEFDAQVANAEAAGAKAVIIYNDVSVAGLAHRRERRDGGAFEAMLVVPARIPVIAVVSREIGTQLAQQYFSGHPPAANIEVRAERKSATDYNLIADSRFGDPARVVVVDAHLDSIFGAGMLDNASGSATILQTALELAHTKTRNRLRFIWFGGEELGLLGSHYYTRHLSRSDLHRIVFDIDVDVTATPNFDILVADPAHAFNATRFPPDVVPDSRVGNRAFADYFRSIGVASRNASFGNDGTDSNSFARAGIPDSGILTQQDCCKKGWEVALWGGYPGDYEGEVPGWHEACVDIPDRWCDNISNNDPFVLELVTKAVAAVTLKLANDISLKHRSPAAAP